MPTPPGWYRDQQPGELRYWDGTRWTHHTAPVVDTRDRISGVAVVLAFVPVVGFLTGVVALARGQKRTGVLVCSIGLLSFVFMPIPLVHALTGG